MLIDYFFSILTVAGIAVLWRNLLKDLAWLKHLVGKLPWILKKAVSCGFCFTYWLSLFFVILCNPLQGWLPPLRIDLSSYLILPLQILMSWMIVGIGSVIIRFGYAALQELVHHQVHTVSQTDPHTH